jgi:hypothetical protein
MSDEAQPQASQPAAVTSPQGGDGAPAAPQQSQPAQTGNGESDQDRNWRRLQGDRDYWRDRAAQLEQQQTRQPAEKQQEEQGAKTLADFEFDDAKYQSYLLEQAEKRAEKAAERKLQEQSERQAAERRKAAFEDRQKAFAKDHPDYSEIVSNPRFTQSDALLAEIMESEEGPAIAMYLASNLSEANRLNAMSAVEVARAVAKLENKLHSEREKAKAAKNQLPVGDQPAPTPKIDGASEGSGASVKPDSPDSDKLSDAEWMRRRNAQVKAKRAK